MIENMKDFGSLYEETEKVLNFLKEKHELIILSSCTKKWIYYYLENQLLYRIAYLPPL